MEKLYDRFTEQLNYIGQQRNTLCLSLSRSYTNDDRYNRESQEQMLTTIHSRVFITIFSGAVFSNEYNKCCADIAANIDEVRTFIILYKF